MATAPFNVSFGSVVPNLQLAESYTHNCTFTSVSGKRPSPQDDSQLTCASGKEALLGQGLCLLSRNMDQLPYWRTVEPWDMSENPCANEWILLVLFSINQHGSHWGPWCPSVHSLTPAKLFKKLRGIVRQFLDYLIQMKKKNSTGVWGGLVNNRATLSLECGSFAPSRFPSSEETWGGRCFAWFCFQRQPFWVWFCLLWQPLRGDAHHILSKFQRYLQPQKEWGPLA